MVTAHFRAAVDVYLLTIRVDCRTEATVPGIALREKTHEDGEAEVIFQKARPYSLRNSKGARFLLPPIGRRVAPLTHAPFCALRPSTHVWDSTGIDAARPALAVAAFGSPNRFGIGGGLRRRCPSRLAFGGLVRSAA